MSSIRKQSIVSSLVIYLGFSIGLLNTYFFTRHGVFLEPQYGLYNAFIAIATTMMAFANLSMPSYIYKFYPYYKDHLPAKKNEQLTLALIVAVIGFMLVIVAGIVFKDLVVRKYSEHSPEIVAYYNWIFPLGFGFLVFAILEAYSWQLHRSVLTNFLKEVVWRLFTTVLIVLLMMPAVKNFDLFIKLFAFSYPFIAVLLLIYLISTRQIHFVFRISKVTRRFGKSILRLCSFIYASSLIATISLVFDSLVISSVLDDAMTKLAVYSIAQNISSMIQAPQRGIVAASIAHLSVAWKEKNMEKIQRIYQRSSINQLIFSCGLFALIVLNFTDAVRTFELKGTYLNAYYVVILLGLQKIIDMGTGVNAQIIGTSTKWKFEMYSGIMLLTLMLPLTYYLTRRYDILGPGYANVISITIYNGVRILFLWKKFRLFPFTIKSLYGVLLAAGCFAACYYAFAEIHGWLGLILRSIAFVVLFGAGVLWLKLSPDVRPVLITISKRLKLKKD